MKFAGAAALCAQLLTSVEAWWRSAQMWTLMYRGGVLAGAGALTAFVLGRFAAARRERVRLEALVASRTRQLRQSELLFRSIFEHASEGIFQSSLDGRNLRANPAMARLCGYDDPAEMQRELTDIAARFYVQPGRREEIAALVARDGAALGCESEIRRRDGSTRWVSESVQSVVDPATGQNVYQGSVVDITARRETQAAQERARLAAEAANAAKTAFLTHVTHELRTPLTGILSNARVALRDDALDDANRARYRLIVTSGEHLLALIDEVLDLSRIEAGHLELRPSPFSLDEFLHTVTEAFVARAAEKPLEFCYRLDPQLASCTVHTDSLRLRQVLDNLLGNAFKFTVQGRVTLRVDFVENTGVRFEVADTGVGIPTEQCAVIFEPFRQVPSLRTTDQSGVGLGLNISARLVQALGGELKVTSIPDQGSRFFFVLPVQVESNTEGSFPGLDGQRSVPKAKKPFAGARAVLPSAAQMDALLTFSLQGDIVRLRSCLRELAAANAGLADFADEVDALAAGFRMDAISEFLMSIHKEGEESTSNAL